MVSRWPCRSKLFNGVFFTTVYKSFVVCPTGYFTFIPGKVYYLWASTSSECGVLLRRRRPQPTFVAIAQVTIMIPGCECARLQSLGTLSSLEFGPVPAAGGRGGGGGGGHRPRRRARPQPAAGGCRHHAHEPGDEQVRTQTTPG